MHGFLSPLFKEGGTYVAYVPALDISSCGATDDEARRNIRDAVCGYLSASAELGTLYDILEQSGYERKETGGARRNSYRSTALR